MMQKKTLVAVALFSASCYARYCGEWTSSDADNFVARCMAGVAAGIVLSIVFTAIAATPLCCGYCKEYGKIIAGLSLGIGLVSIVCPLFGALGACAGVVADVCSDCTGAGASGCTAEEEAAILDGCNGLGVLYVYTAAFGFIAVIMGIVSSALACCIFCGCCKMKKDEAFVDGGNKATSGTNKIAVASADEGDKLIESNEGDKVTSA